MPEGDTVWLTAQRLHRALSGRVLTRSQFRVPQYAEVDLSGQEVVETVSRGKHLLTRIGEVTLHTHMKMEGSWHVYRAGSAWRSPGHQARVVLANDHAQAVGFRLGVVDLVPRSEEHSVVGHLGPDLLGPDWSADEAMRRIHADPSRPIGEALLDQRNLAGIGNLYKCEACFVAGVHPGTPVESLAAGDGDVLAKLVDTAQRMLAANKHHGEQSTTGNLRRGEQHWVYRRSGVPCRRCGTQILEATFATTEDVARGVTPYDVRGGRSGGATGAGSKPRAGKVSAVGRPSQARVTYWCPSCQPAPS